MSISAGGGQGHGQIFSEINITPLTDIFLVLLIIMMVIAPSMQKDGKPMSLPRVENGEVIDDKNVTLEIIKEGNYFVNGNEVPSNKLAGALKQALQSSGQTEERLVVRADKDTESSVVLGTFDAARDAGFKKMTIAGEPLSQQHSNELRRDSHALPTTGDHI